MKVSSKSQDCQCSCLPKVTSTIPEQRLDTSKRKFNLLQFFGGTPSKFLPIGQIVQNICAVFCEFCHCLARYCISANSFHTNYSFLNLSNVENSKYVVVTIILALCIENLNTFLTRLRKLFKRGNYSREETICGNTVIK